MKADLQALAKKAKKVLDGNWMGSATKPAPGLYPHQWSRKYSIYFDWDLVTDSPIDAHVAAGFSPLSFLTCFMKRKG